MMGSAYSTSTLNQREMGEVSGKEEVAA